MKASRIASAAVLVRVLAAGALGATFSDSAANYEGAIQTFVDNISFQRMNGGEGFGPWAVEGEWGTHAEDWIGCGAWDPSANGFLGTWAGKTKAIGIVAKGQARIWATRPFGLPLAVGETFSMDMAVNWDSNAEGARKGFAVKLGESHHGGPEIVAVNHGNWPGKISVNGDDGHAVLNAHGLHPMRWTFTPLDATTLRVTATARNDPSKTFSTNIAVETAFIESVMLVSENQYAGDPSQEDADKRQTYFDNFALEVDGTRLGLVRGELAATGASYLSLFGLGRFPTAEGVEVTVTSSNPSFIQSTTAEFEPGNYRALFFLRGTLTGSGDVATLTATAEGYRPVTWEVRGPVCTLSVAGDAAAAGAEVPFRVRWDPAGAPFDASKIALACEPEGAFDLPGTLDWTEETAAEGGGIHVDGTATARADGTLVLLYDGVRFGECAVAVGEPDGTPVFDPALALPVTGLECRGEHAVLTLDEPPSAVFRATEVKDGAWQWQPVGAQMDGRSVVVPLVAPLSVFCVQ